MINYFSLIVFAFFINTSETPAQEKTSINWISISELEALSAKEAKPVIIDVYTNWCGWCKRMDQNTFNHPDITEFINENYYAVKFNAESKDSLVYRGNTFKYIPGKKGKKGVHGLAAALLQGRMSYPTIVYMDKELNLIQAVPGYMDAKQIEPVLNYFVEEGYKSQPFEEYQKGFTSKIE